MKQTIAAVLLLLTVSLTRVAAGGGPEERPAGIEWFDGGVEAAFDAARAEDKPVFLYWGAVWCPYCADLKAHVFSRADFRSKLELFVPVYLDGDDPGAQRWGEELGVFGYPTVLVLTADRRELARIAGGMDLTVYTDVLDLALSDTRPLRDVLASLAMTSGPLPTADCRRLAFNGWGLDDSVSAGGRLAAALAGAAGRCPADARVERARLTAVAAHYAAEAEAEAVEAGRAATPLLAQLVDDVRGILADPSLAVSIADALQYLDTDFFAVARQLGPTDSARLLQRWSAAMRAVAADERYTEGDRLAAVRARIEAHKVLSGDGRIPQALAAEALQRIDSSLAAADGTPGEPAVVNAAVNLLVTLERSERAYAVAEEAMRDAATPYYYMADLAWLDEQLGREDAAVAWLERAYRESAGAATRFQWGTNYVRGLVRMRPHDVAAITDAAIAVLGELEAPDTLYRRTRTRLAALDAALREWSATYERDEALRAIHRRMQRICENLSTEGRNDAVATCREFLSGAV
ncbi:MAG: thioredoxin family protein [Gammaproteobacteria bacterium]|nr:thioredoxin family protein [Gammaproteobacteria bacterium]